MPTITLWVPEDGTHSPVRITPTVGDSGCADGDTEDTARRVTGTVCCANSGHFTATSGSTYIVSSGSSRKSIIADLSSNTNGIAGSHRDRSSSIGDRLVNSRPRIFGSVSKSSLNHLKSYLNCSSVHDLDEEGLGATISLYNCGDRAGSRTQR